MMQVPRENRIQCLVVGDAGVGKTTMLLHYATNRFASCHGLKVFDNYAGVLKVGKHDYRLDLLDTTEHPDIEDRRQRFPGTDVIIICFSVINPDSFKNVQTKWIPELRKALGVTPFIILGTHVDLRQDPDVLQQLQIKGQKPVSSRVASAACRRLGGKCYVESSSTMKTRMRQALDEALLSVFNPDLNRSTCCVQ